MGKNWKVKVFGWLVFMMVAALGWCGNGKVVAYSDSFMEGDYSYYINNEGTVSINRYYGGDSIIVVPKLIAGKEVTEICPLTFWKNNIIEKVTIPEGINTIGFSAFENCVNLKKVELPDSLQFIGEKAFSDTNIESIDIPLNVQTVENFTFKDCKNLKRVTFISANAAVGESVFENCINLEEVTLPSELQTIRAFLFKDCYKIEKIVIPDDVYSIEYGAFEKCSSLRAVRLSTNLKLIAAYAFNRAAIREIMIPHNVDEIGMYAFDSCTSMERIFISNPTTIIGECAIPIETTIFANKESSSNQYAMSNGNPLVDYTVPQKLSFSEGKINLAINGVTTQVLKLTTQPTNASTSLITWDSSNKKVATVDSTGKVKAVGNGDTTITAKTTDGTNLTASCSISVTTNVSSVKLQKNKITLNLSNKKQDKLNYSYAPSNATNTKITWTSSNKSVAIVANNGVVTAKSVGNATIKVSINGKTATCEVTVNPKSVTMFNSPTQGTKAVLLKWNKVEGINGYRLFRYDSSTKKDILIYQSTSNKTTYKTTRINGAKGKRLSAGMNITYKIQTYRIVNGITYYSDKKTLATGTKPNTPAITKLSSISNKRGIKVSWKKVPGVSAYEIYMSTSKTKNFKKIAIVSENSYNTLNLTKGKTYYFKIRAISANKIYSATSKVRYLKVK